MDIKTLLDEGIVLESTGEFEIILRRRQGSPETPPEARGQAPEPPSEAPEADGRVTEYADRIRQGNFRQKDLVRPILERVSERPMSPAALARALGVQDVTARRHADRLVEAGKLIKNGNGAYQLPDTPTAFHPPGELEKLTESLRAESATPSAALKPHGTAPNRHLLRRVAALLEVGPQPLTKIIEVTGASVSELNIALGDMIGGGYVQRLPGNTFSLIKRLEN